MKYLVVYQQIGNKFSAFVPDVPSCVATGDSEEQARARIRDALYLSVHTLRRPPTPAAFTEEIDSDEASDEVRTLLS